MSQDFDARIARIAQRQHGIFTRAQAVALGATKGVIQRRLGVSRWERIARDVFRLEGTPRTWQQELMAACLAWGPDAVVSHRSAAALWKLPGFEPGPVELTVPRYRRRVAPGTIHQSALERRDVAPLAGFRLTTPDRTLVDVAGASDADVVEEALDDALRRGLTSLARLGKTVDGARRNGRAGTVIVRALVRQRDPATVPMSVFETRLFRALRRAGLPRPIVQHEIGHDGRLVAIVDFAYPAVCLALETDGYRWHSGRVRWERDRARRNELTLLGWRVLHVTWAQLTRDEHAVVAAIGRSLSG